MLWSIRREYYREYLIEKENTFILTYIEDGKQKTSEVFPREIKVVTIKDKKPECQLVFDFYDVLTEHGNPKTLYITSDRFVKLEPK